MKKIIINAFILLFGTTQLEARVMILSTLMSFNHRMTELFLVEVPFPICQKISQRIR